MIVLDTNVLSELLRKAPNIQVMHWTGIQPIDSLHIASVTKAEILYGIELLPPGVRRQQIETATFSLFAEDFHHRVLALDEAAAPIYARLVADRRAKARPISQFDAQIAAITRLHDATLATRTTNDFVGSGVQLVNPWNS